MAKFCEHYQPWVTTSQGELCNACVMKEKRIIKRCYYYANPQDCEQFEEYKPKK